MVQAENRMILILMQIFGVTSTSNDFYRRVTAKTILTVQRNWVDFFGPLTLVFVGYVATETFGMDYTALKLAELLEPT